MSLRLSKVYGSAGSVRPGKEMAIGRSRYAPPYVSTKGHSVLKQRSYAMPTRTPPTSNVSRSSSVAYDTRAEEYLLSDRVNNVNYLSNSLLDEGYDTAKRSRGRDQQLLKEATNAIPRGSLRDTATLTASSPPYGSRRFSRRFGKTRFSKNEGSSLYDSGISGEDRSLPTSDLMASVGPAPNRSWRRYGRARSTSAAKSYFGDDNASPDTSAYPSRASSVGRLSPSRSSYLSPSPISSPRTSRRLPPPFPMTRMSESKVLDSGSSKSWGQSVSPSRLSNYSSPTRPDYDPLYVEYEPDIKPLTTYRRRQKVLGSSRRPAGNYYERLLKKRNKRQGRFGPYYDVESIEGSDLSGVLSDVDSFDGTYDNDSDYESSSVSPSSYQHLSTALSPSSPYYVDQDTEFVPFKPSRPLQTKGLLELSSHGDVDDNDESSNSQPLPSPNTDLFLSRYLPSSLVSAATSASSPTLSHLPYRSVVPYSSSLSDDSLGVVPSSTPSGSQRLLESMVSSSIERAKNAINNLAIPEYSGASLLLSVEGAGLSPEGKRVDFTYTPPPIPLYGRTLALDDKMLGIRPSSTIKPLDKFISGYVERMGALRAALNDRLDKDKAKRIQYGLKPLDTGPYTSRTYSSYTPKYSSSYEPSYTQSHEYVPVKHLSSRKLEHLPVTTFRRRQDDGNTQRVDVFSLGEFRPRLSSSTARSITIPESATGGHQLSVLDKINIKVSSESYATPQTSVASRRVARGRSQAPRAASVPPRPLRSEVDSSQVSTVTSTTAPTVSQAPPSPRAKRPIVIRPAPEAAAAGRGHRATSVPPVVVFREGMRQKAQVVPVSTREEWRNRAKARSVPPPPVAALPRHRPYRGPEKKSVVPVQAAVREALPTAGLRAHKVPRRFLTRSGMRTGFSSLHGYYADEPGDRNRQADSEGFRMSVTRARVLSSPVSRTKVSSLPPNYIPPKPKPAPIRESLSQFPKVYVPTKGPKPSNRSKAAIIASKLEPDPLKRRRPRSEYAANKYRELRKESQESASGGSSSGLHGSSYKSDIRTTSRTAEDEDVQPKTIMSWQYRLDSITSPSDLLYQPSALIRIRERVKDAQEKMNRHREMIDKYLPEEGEDSGDVASSIRRKMAAMERRDPISYRSGGGADEPFDTNGIEASSRPVSDLRRRIRRTLNKSRYS